MNYITKNQLKCITIASILSLLVVSPFIVKGQVTVTPAGAVSPQSLVQSVLVGTGVTVSNVSFNGSATALGYTNQIGAFTTGISPSNIGFNNGLIMSTGGITGSTSDTTSTAINGTDYTNVPELQQYNPNGTVFHNAAVLEFDFVPLSDTIKFRYAFASYEYISYVCTQYNDIFGFFISGQNPAGGNYVSKNIALIPSTNLPVSINSVNDGTPNGTVTPCYTNYTQFYHVPTSNVTYYGMTTVLTAIAAVVPCTPYHIKLAIVDLGDESFDSGVFLEANSFSSTAVAVSQSYSTPNAKPMAIEDCNDAYLKFTIPYAKSDTTWIPLIISGSAQNGVDYSIIPDSVFVAPGQLNTTLLIHPLQDNLVEPIEYVKIKVLTTVCTSDSISIPIMSWVPYKVVARNDTSICDSKAQLWASTADGLNPLLYEWDNPSLLNDPNIINPMATLTSSTIFIIKVSDSTGCPPVYDTVNVIVNTKPVINFDNVPSLPYGCAPLTLNFINDTDPLNSSFTWDMGNGTASQTTQVSPTYTYTTPGTYTVKLIAKTLQGCEDSIQLTNLVKVYENPDASFSVSPPMAPITNAFFSFTDQSSSAVTNWYWNFNDPASSSNISNLQNPTHTYTVRNPYTVWLKVAIKYHDPGTNTDVYCYDSTSRLIRVVEDSITVPNVITPNGDGINDYFKVTSLEYYIGNQFVVYNRWGKKVYEKDNYIPDKDRFDGEGLPDGTYFFILKYSGYLNSGERSGSLTILRGK